MLPRFILGERQTLRGDNTGADFFYNDVYLKAVMGTRNLYDSVWDKAEYLLHDGVRNLTAAQRRQVNDLYDRIRGFFGGEFSGSKKRMFFPTRS